MKPNGHPKLCCCLACVRDQIKRDEEARQVYAETTVLVGAVLILALGWIVWVHFHPLLQVTQ